ncbi:MAG TPA: alcohol dehydrogenase catalytic domain-containing protein [Pyrinomonadaceae bacterium]|nr:alcohol dehydrogenase catalytic domain-containing protein [Pyrinomonadaceae bacterium]
MSTSIETFAKETTPHESGATMRAGVLCGVERVEVRDVPQPVAGPHEVVVRVSAVGLCGTDAHIFAGHANYNTDEYGQPIPFDVDPQILGHEISGVVEESGREVNDLSAGDRVVIDQGLNCISLRRESLCEYCRTGDSHQCEFYAEHGITGLPGGLAEFIAVPAVNAISIRTDLNAAEAAMAEPLGCVIHASDAANRAQARYHLNGSKDGRHIESILVCGAGPAGLMFVQYLRCVLGYEGLLLVSEPNTDKRSLAIQFGADHGIDPGDRDAVEAVHEYTSGKGVDYLIEASGAGRVLAFIPGLIRKQATVLLYGHGHAGVDLSVLNNLMFREPALVTPVGASGGFEADGRPSAYLRALNLIEEKRIEVAPLITHRYTSLKSVQTALASDIHTPGYIKGVVTL